MVYQPSTSLRPKSQWTIQFCSSIRGNFVPLCGVSQWVISLASCSDNQPNRFSFEACCTAIRYSQSPPPLRFPPFWVEAACVRGPSVKWKTTPRQPLHSMSPHEAVPLSDACDPCGGSLEKARGVSQTILLLACFGWGLCPTDYNLQPRGSRFSPPPIVERSSHGLHILPWPRQIRHVWPCV